MPEVWKNYAQNKSYPQLYEEINVALMPETGLLWQQIHERVCALYESSKKWSYEWMLALREGPQEEDQEGIWHDDSSRDLALSLSLNLEPSLIQGGELRLRPRSHREQVTSVAPRPWAHGHIFATGKWDWEHKTSRVSSGNRLVLVVWISLTA